MFNWKSSLRGQRIRIVLVVVRHFNVCRAQRPLQSFSLSSGLDSSAKRTGSDASGPLELPSQRRRRHCDKTRKQDE